MEEGAGEEGLEIGVLTLEFGCRSDDGSGDGRGVIGVSIRVRGKGGKRVLGEYKRQSGHVSGLEHLIIH